MLRGAHTGSGTLWRQIEQSFGRLPRDHERMSLGLRNFVTLAADPRFADMASRLSLPLVATNDVHYAEASDAEVLVDSDDESTPGTMVK